MKKEIIDSLLQRYFPDDYYQAQREKTIPLIEGLLNYERIELKDSLKKKLNSFSKDKHGRIFTTEVIELIDKL